MLGPKKPAWGVEAVRIIELNLSHTHIGSFLFMSTHGKTIDRPLNDNLYQSNYHGTVTIDTLCAAPKFAYQTFIGIPRNPFLAAPC